MSERPADERAAQQSLIKRRSTRVRDVSVVAIGAMAVFMLLALSGALGWVEAFTACIVMLAGAMAYYVGSSQPEPPEPAQRPDETGEIDTFAPTLSSVLAAIPLPAVYVSPDQRIEAANAPARELFRLREEARSLAASVIRHPALLAALERAMFEQVDDTVEMPRAGDGEQVWLAHIAPHQGLGAGALVVFEDRTEVRRAERARADFLANASHELRTPLTSLAGFIETMRGPAREDRESWDRFLDIMFEQTERMKRLIADLLSLSRIEFSEHKPPEREDDVAAIVHASVQSLRPVAAERGSVLEHVGPQEGLRAVIVSDEITQVVQNLIVNAVKYSGRDAQIRISCGLAGSMNAARALAGRQWEDAARMTIAQPPHGTPVPAVWVRVEDNGPGIEREHLPRLGQRFYRVDESRGGEVTGTGLGLAIVKHVMARHRGGLIVESRPGEGSAFGVWWRAAPGAALTPATAELHAQAGRSGEDGELTGGRIV